MPDIFCSKCGEPWDLYELHDIIRPNNLTLTFNDAAKQFSQFGCGAFTTGNPEPCTVPVVDQYAADTAKVKQEFSPYPDKWIS